MRLAGQRGTGGEMKEGAGPQGSAPLVSVAPGRARRLFIAPLRSPGMARRYPLRSAGMNT